MSFSSDVKEEIIKEVPTARHCAIAELAAIISICGILRDSCIIYSENKLVLKRTKELIRIVFRDKVRVSLRGEYDLVAENNDQIGTMLQTLKINIDNTIVLGRQINTDNLIVQKNCCKRSFIRGAFLASGSVSNPVKAYHFEIVFQNIEAAEQLINIFQSFNIEAKSIERGKYIVLYIKESSQIVDTLNIIGAHIALMEFENVRIVKEVRNSVNRQVNCETANISKTVAAASKQIEDIDYIRKTIGLEHLSDGLREAAELRLTFPDMALKELGEMFDHPIGKSGVNHRLKKISMIAENLRDANL